MIFRARFSIALGCLIASAAPRAAAQSSGDLRQERTMGSPAAPVTMYIISDFECPFCGDFARKTFPLIEHDYVTTGKMKVVFVNLPLSAIHPNAEPAAEAAMCAARQNKFWPMHNLLFRYQTRWVDLMPPRPFFLGLADSIGLNRPAFTTCLDSGETLPLVRADSAGSVRSGANATPSFYIEGGLMSGDRPYDQFRPILDSIYRAKTTKAGTPR